MLLAVYEVGKSMANEFKANRILSDRKAFHDPIPRKKVPAFQSVKVKISTKKSASVIEAKGNIIGKLLSISAKEEQGTDFEKALRYSVYSVPLCLAHPDGSRRSNSKNKLLDIIITDPTSITETPTTIIREQSTFVLDMIAQIRSCITNLPDTYEEFILKFLQTIPKRFWRVDIVADCYRDNSIIILLFIISLFILG